jgi:hypothetical protein
MVFVPDADTLQYVEGNTSRRAIASGARVAVLIWEGDNGIEVATVPQAKAVARGLIDYAQEAIMAGETETEEEEE